MIFGVRLDTFIVSIIKLNELMNYQKLKCS